MINPPKKRLIFRWTTPKNFLAILIFITLTVITEYLIITYTIPTDKTDPTTFTIPYLNITLSLLYHFLPTTVIITLTLSFTHLTTHTASIPKKPPTPKKPSLQRPRKKSIYLKPLRKFYKKLQKATRKIKNKILKIQTIAYIEHRIILAKAIIKSATTTITLFIVISILLTFAAYPKLLSTATANFYQGNPAFLNFIVATIKASQAIAEAIPPIGAIAATIQNALIAIAPTFRNALQATASAIADGLVALTQTEKYLIIQNIAAWTVALTALLYSQYVKSRRYRR